MTYKTEVQKMYQMIASKMGIQAPPFEIKGSDKELNAIAWTKKITMTEGLAQLVYKERQLVESLIAHELTHFNNQDTQTNYKNSYRFFTKKAKAYSLLFELRASIAGYTYNGMKTEKEIWEIDIKFKIPKFHDDNKSAYKFGYPTSKQIAYYASRTNKLTLDIAKEILEDFCGELKVKNKEVFIQDVLKVAKVH